jgi:hypothetical protein
VYHACTRTKSDNPDIYLNLVTKTFTIFVKLALMLVADNFTELMPQLS